jgi:cytochrome P450
MEVIAAYAFVFFVAGFETSSTTMTFCLYELVMNPDLQERVRNEIDTVLEKCGGNITYESVFEMEYFEKFLDGKSINCSVVNRSIRYIKLLILYVIRQGLNLPDRG